MARMKDFRDKFISLKDKFKSDKPEDLSLKLSYDTNVALNNISVTKELCSEMRRIGSYGIVTYSISEDDKKTKKSLNSLSQLFSETSSKFQDSDPMQGPLNSSAYLFTKINGFTKDFEKNLQHQVIEPLAEIESICNEIYELRKKLHDQRRELGNMSEKLGRLVDQTNPDEQKAHAMKDQIEELEMEFENVSDLYMQKVLQFEASNFEHAQSIYEMILLRHEYHDKCSKELMKIIPEANQFMEDRRTPYSFRYPLENHLKEIKKCIAYPIEKCVTALSNVEDLRQEGLFRVSGGKTKSNLLCSVLNVMKFDQMNYKWSPHVFADVLKRYLRELPVPLLGKVNVSDWDSCYEKFKSGNQQDAYWQIKELLNKMPKSYYNNLEYLIRFLIKVIQEKSYNLMTVQNICTVFTPNLFRPLTEGSGSIGMNMDISASCTFILESLLNETNFFFSHSNQKATSPLLSPDSKTASLIRISVFEKNGDKSPILFRRFSDKTLDSIEQRPDVEVRQLRRRHRCLGSDIFAADESHNIAQFSHSSVSSSFSDSNPIEFHFSSITPRRNKNQ